MYYHYFNIFVGLFLIHARFGPPFTIGLSQTHLKHTIYFVFIYSLKKSCQTKVVLLKFLNCPFKNPPFKDNSSSF